MRNSSLRPQLNQKGWLPRQQHQPRSRWIRSCLMRILSIEEQAHPRPAHGSYSRPCKCPGTASAHAEKALPPCSIRVASVTLVHPG